MAQPALQRRDAPEPEVALGSGDQIVLRVSELDELPKEPIRIDPNGNLDLPMIGTTHVAGMTATEIKAKLTAAYSKYIQSPEVTLNVTEYQSRPVSVLGSVAHAGVYQMQGPKRLAEVLSLAGGAAVDAGPDVVVTRKQQWGKVSAPGASTSLAGGDSSVSIPINNIMSGKVPGDNILVMPDDVIAVPRAELVYVVGNVRHAGAFALNQNSALTVAQAVSLAQGFTPDAAASHARILRRVENNATPLEIKVDANRILAGKAADQPLMANDILFIPNSAMKASSKRVIEAAIGISTGMLIYR
ncbi:polysaccharide biosynthesis/export family protein [Terriglobus aquaticus]|uniref:Polysaccharide biosynthesis/export family protein n=1 Tax=Terriglobus aquaticus TaxID=940139 RepID=A0ABW9KIM5_9BACT|nr:polysaccharide biosynthesis/export family protein [Terriglobus aquaticus]